jgi:hypothetical protein
MFAHPASDLPAFIHYSQGVAMWSHAPVVLISPVVKKEFDNGGISRTTLTYEKVEGAEDELQ